MSTNDDLTLWSGRMLSRPGSTDPPHQDTDGESEQLGLIIQVVRMGGEPLGELFAENTIRAMVKVAVGWTPLCVVHLMPERAAILFRPNQLLSRTAAKD